MGLGDLWRRVRSRPGAAPAVAVTPVVSAPRPVGAWRSLPPIQRTVAAAPLIAPNATFEAGLAASQPAPIALAMLGHDRRLEAPAGLATGLATPVQRAPDGSVPASTRPRPGSRPVPGRQPGPSLPAGAAGRGARDPGAPDAEPVGAASSSVLPTGTDAASDLLASAVEGPATAETVPTTSTPIVARRIDAAPLIRSTSGPVPLVGQIGRRATERAVAHRDAATSAPGAPAPRTDPADGSTAATAARVTGSATPDAVLPQPGDEPAVVARRVDARRANLGQSRRLRIGAPIRPVSGLPAAGPTPAPPVGRLPGDPTAVPGGPGPTPGLSLRQPGGVPSADVVAQAERAPATTVSRSVAQGAAANATDATAADAIGPSAAGPGGDGPEDDDAVALRPFDVSRSVAAPLVGTLRPRLDAARPAIAIRAAGRAADEEAGPSADDSAGSTAAALAALGLVDPAAGAFGPRSRDAASRAGGSPGTPGVIGPGPGALPGGAAPSTGQSGRPVVARSLPTGASSAPFTATAPARDSAGRRPASPTVARAAAFTAPGAASLGAGTPSAGTGSWSAGVSSWDASTGFLTAPSGSASDPAAATPATPGGAPLVARSFAASPAALPAAVQRQEEAAATVVAESPGTSRAAAGSSAGAGAGMPDAELDELARKLYERFGNRLRRDLIVERERAGLLVDRGW